MRSLILAYKMSSTATLQSQSHCIARHVENSGLQLQRTTFHLPSSQNIVLENAEYPPRFSCLKDDILFRKRDEWTRSIALSFEEES